MRVNYLIVSIDETRMFGWNIDNDLMAGWGEGTWGVAPGVTPELAAAWSFDFSSSFNALYVAFIT